MSFETWAEEFYPIPAEEATGSELEAAEHSLRKWRGRLAGVPEKHGLTVERQHFRDPEEGIVFFFDASTCALCGYAVNNTEQISEETVLAAHPNDDPSELLEMDDCLNCPFTREFKRSCSAEYHAASHDGAVSMVGALDKLVTILKAKEGKKDLSDIAYQARQSFSDQRKEK